MDADSDRINQITERVIGCAYEVSNTLGSGFLEKVYENALTIECRKQGLAIEQQHAIDVHYHKVVVGQFFADLLVNNSVIVELKVVRTLDDVHMAQCMNYLKATNLKVCLLINFGLSRIEIRRVVNNF